MFRLIFLCGVASLLAPTASAQGIFSWLGSSSEEQSIEWIDDPAEALAAARQTGKPVLAYVTSANCGFCRKMEKETWAEPDVAEQVGRDFVPLRLHADKHPDEVAALRVRAYPTTVFITAQGQAFAGRQGFVEAAKMDELLRDALKPRTVAARPAAPTN